MLHCSDPDVSRMWWILSTAEDSRRCRSLDSRRMGDTNAPYPENKHKSIDPSVCWTRYLMQEIRAWIQNHQRYEWFVKNWMKKLPFSGQGSVKKGLHIIEKHPILLANACNRLNLLCQRGHWTKSPWIDNCLTNWVNNSSHWRLVAYPSCF